MNPGSMACREKEKWPVASNRREKEAAFIHFQDSNFCGGRRSTVQLLTFLYIFGASLFSKVSFA